MNQKANAKKISKENTHTLNCKPMGGKNSNQSTSKNNSQTLPQHLIEKKHKKALNPQVIRILHSVENTWRTPYTHKDTCWSESKCNLFS